MVGKEPSSPTFLRRTLPCNFDLDDRKYTSLVMREAAKMVQTLEWAGWCDAHGAYARRFLDNMSIVQTAPSERQALYMLALLVEALGEVNAGQLMNLDQEATLEVLRLFGLSPSTAASTSVDASSGTQVVGPRKGRMSDF